MPANETTAAQWIKLLVGGNLVPDWKLLYMGDRNALVARHHFAPDQLTTMSGCVYVRKGELPRGKPFSPQEMQSRTAASTNTR